MESIQIENWLEETIGKEVFHPGLTRVAKAIDHLNLHPKSKIITVGGTNGKGSVTRSLYQSLQQKYSVALFTSPHLYSIKERFLSTDKELTLEQLFSHLQNIHKQLTAKGISLTYFEMLFVVFLYWCQDKWPDFLILEVGLGGRLDATNCLDADLSVICSIGRDHQEFLGHSYKKILNEKLAISRKNKPLITAFRLEYLKNIAEAYTRENGVQWINIPCGRDFQQTNENLVTAVIKNLNLNLPAKLAPMKKTFSHRAVDVEFIGSHNPAAVRKLVHFIAQEYYNNTDIVYDYLILSFSQRSLQDVTHMLRLFKSLSPNVVKKIIVTKFDHTKAMDSEVLKEISQQNGIEFVKDYKEKFSSPCTILASGSNYFYRHLYTMLGPK